MAVDKIGSIQENTLISDSGDAILSDFGLARILEDDGSGLTTSSVPDCTLWYTAPELVAGDGLVHSRASDVWAWDCLLLVVSSWRSYPSERSLLTPNEILTAVCHQGPRCRN